MITTIKFDTRQFNRTIEKAVRESSRSAQEVVNNHIYAVAAKAANFTRIAQKEKIAADLGQVASKLIRGRKTGKLRVGRRVFDDKFTLAGAIINARLKKAGKPMIHGDDLDRAIRKLVANRLRSVGFIASGWIRAALEMKKYVSGVSFKLPRGIAIVGQSKGTAKPAVKGLLGSGKFFGSIENSALVESGGKFQAPGQHNPVPIAESALRKATEDENAQLEGHLARKMTDGMKRAGAM